MMLNNISNQNVRPFARKGKSIFIAIAAGLLAAACGSPSYVNKNASSAEIDQAAPSLETVTYRVHNSFRENPPSCVAVMPLDDNGKLKPAERDGVRRIFYAQLAPQKKRDVELHVIDSALSAMPEEFRKDVGALGHALDCDAILTGRITHYGSGFYGLYSNVTVGADVKIIRAVDGETLWEGKHIATSHGGTVPLTPVGLVSGVVSAASNLNDEQLIRVTNDLARRLISTIPDEKSYLYSKVSRLELRRGPGADYPVADLTPLRGELEYIGPSDNPEWVVVRGSNGELAYAPVIQLANSAEAVADNATAKSVLASCRSATFDKEDGGTLHNDC